MINFIGMYSMENNQNVKLSILSMTFNKYTFCYTNNLYAFVRLYQSKSHWKDSIYLIASENFLRKTFYKCMNKSVNINHFATF